MHKIDKVICGLISDLALCLQIKLSNQELSDVAESCTTCRKNGTLIIAFEIPAFSITACTH